MKLSKSIGVVALAVAILGGGIWWYKQRTDAAAKPNFKSAAIERGSITATVSATGTLNAVLSVSVSSQVSGQVKEVLTDFNSEVRKDQVIAKLDPEQFQYRVRQAQADVDAAKANVSVQLSQVSARRSDQLRAQVNLEEATRDLQRKTLLVEKNFISPVERDKASALVRIQEQDIAGAKAQMELALAQSKNAEAVVKQREAQLASAKIDLDRTIIKAPVDGVVIKRSVESGQTVAASLNAPELFVIAQNLREMQVDVSIDEAEISRVKTGQKATFTIDAFPGRTFSGEVKQVRKSATNVQNVITYVAVVSAQNNDLSLVPGLTANVRLVVDQRENTLKVQNAALRFRPPAGTTGAEGSAATAGSGAPGTGAGAAAGGGAGGGPGGAIAERARAFRASLETELKLDDPQKQKLGAILDAQRERMRSLRDAPEADRGRMVQQMRAETSERIEAILTPEQRPRYKELAAEYAASSRPAQAGGSSMGGRGRIWVQDADGKVRGIDVRTGISDGTMTEISLGSNAASAANASAEVKEGLKVLTGTVIATDGKKPNTPAGPAGPRMF
jgi:HlyD family secretion protein